MNFDLLIRQFLYQNKSISLPGIGRLQFAPDVQLPAGAGEKSEPIPLQDLQFFYSLQQQADPEFIKFVSSHTGKIAPLAASDVDSHFMLSRQFINIGKAYVIEGVGLIEKKDDGTYGFTPGTYIPVSDAITTTHKPLKVREPQPVIPKNVTPAKKRQVNYKGIFTIISLVLVLGVAAWAAYYFIVKNNNATTAVTPPSTDTTVTTKDTTGLPVSGTNTTNGVATSSDPNAYKAVFETTTDKIRVQKRTAQLKAGGTDARVETNDSVTYKLWIPLNSQTSDTLRKRDSLSKFLGKRVRLEKY